MLMDQNPLVTIVIPVYNGSNFMREAIDSALAQTYSNVEIIVVNDGSTDETESIALSYGDRIRYFRKENGGVSSALNLGIREMRGEYFSWLSHDDKYEPHKIENQIALLSQFDDERLIAVCQSKQINKNSEQILSKKRNERQLNQIIGWEEALMDVIMHGPLNGCALLIPKIAFDDCGLFDESLRYSQDALMWMQIFLKKYRIVFSGDCDVCIRVHNNQLSQTGREIFHKDSRYIGEKLFEPLASISTKKRNYVYQFAKRHAVFNNPRVVDLYISAGKERRLIGPFGALKLWFYGLYGRVRPAVRRAYYRVFKHVKTQ